VFKYKFILFVLIWIGVFTSSFSLSFLWEWFVTPLDIKSISIFQSMGFLLIFGLFRDKSNLKDKMEKEFNFEEDSKYIFSYSILFPLYLLFIGWVAHLFI